MCLIVYFAVMLIPPRRSASNCYLRIELKLSIDSLIVKRFKYLKLDFPLRCLHPALHYMCAAVGIPSSARAF